MSLTKGAIYITCVMLSIFLPAGAQAGLKQIAVQGTITDTGGTPIQGTHDITLRLHNGLSTATATIEYGEIHYNVNLGSTGVFNLMLGAGATDYPGVVLDNLAFNKQYYLGIRVGSDQEMSPVQILGASGYALGSLKDFYVVGNLTVSTNVTVSNGDIEVQKGKITVSTITATSGRVVISNSSVVIPSNNLIIGTSTNTAKIQAILGGTVPDMDGGTSQNVAVFLNAASAADTARINILSGVSGQSILQLGDTSDTDIGSIIYDQGSNYMTFRVNNTSDRIKIDSSGRVTMSGQPCVRAYGAQASIAGYGYATIQSGTESFEQGGDNWNIGTYTYTPPVNGYYLINAQITFLTNTVQTKYACDIYDTNSSTILATGLAHCVLVNNDVIPTVSTILYLTTSSRIVYKGYNAHSASVNVSGDANDTFMCITLLQ